MTDPQTQGQPQWISSDQLNSAVQAAVSAAVSAVSERTENALAQMRADHEAELAALNQALQSARTATPIGLVPEHGGGIGSDVHETWSYAEQLAARAESEAATVVARQEAERRAESRRAAAATIDAATVPDAA